MGQKVHPNAFRLGVYKPWQARWYGDKNYTEMLLEDTKMRRVILERLRNAGISKVETERSANQVTVIIWTAKPGIVIGKGGASVDQLRDDLETLSGKKVRVTIQEIKHPELDAMLVAQNVASQLERRIAFRRAIKQSVLRTMRAGAMGVKIAISGRLGGAEMSRREWDRDGRVPLHTLKANIDFGQTEARTTFGRIGVSVWVYLGEFDLAPAEEAFEEIPARQLLDDVRPALMVAGDGAAAVSAEPPVAATETAAEVAAEAEAASPAVESGEAVQRPAEALTRPKAEPGVRPARTRTAKPAPTAGVPASKARASATRAKAPAATKPAAKKPAAAKATTPHAAGDATTPPTAAVRPRAKASKAPTTAVKKARGAGKTSTPASGDES